MSGPAPRPAEAPATHAASHPNVATYVKVAVVLAIVTALEIGVIYVRRLAPIVVPLLLVMSAAKFSLVVLFFMHLRYDRRPLSILFFGPLVIAAVLLMALITLPGEFLLFKR
jgi:cytochrome c oxidase subunit IV